MPLKKLPFKRLEHLIGVNLSTKEWPPTQTVIDQMSGSTRRGYLTKPELIQVCRWKSPRALRHITRNRAATIRKVTEAAFRTRSEERRMSLLTSLHGVSIPMASSILTLTNPDRYGVIDIRVWQLLHTMGGVQTNADGRGFRLSQWTQYLTILRYFAGRYRVGARDIERTLFTIHVRYQKGTLYNA